MKDKPELLDVVYLPNVRQTEKRQAFRHGEGPDLFAVEREELKHGVRHGERDLHRFPWNPLASKGAFYAGFDPLRALKVLLFDRRADVIVSVFESNVFFVLLLAPIFRFKPKIVLWEVSARGWPIRDWVVEFVAKRVDRVFVLTEGQKTAIEKRCMLKAPADVIGFAVDDVFYSPSSAVHGGPPYVLAVGDDVGRDYATLVKAMAHSGHRLRIRTGRKLEIPASATGLIEIVPRLSYVELRELYVGAEVVVVPLHDMDHASGITAIFEGMAMGRAVIASQIATSRDYIVHGESGWLVPPGDATALAAAIDTLMNDAELRSRIGRQARQAIESRFASRGFARRFAERLHDVARSPG